MSVLLFLFSFGVWPVGFLVVVGRGQDGGPVRGLVEGLVPHSVGWAVRRRPGGFAGAQRRGTCLGTVGADESFASGLPRAGCSQVVGVEGNGDGTAAGFVGRHGGPDTGDGIKVPVFSHTERQSGAIGPT